jgi:hypothetical protein
MDIIFHSFSLLLRTNPPIREAFTLNPFSHQFGTLNVSKFAMRVTEIKLSNITLKVLLSNMVKRTKQTALEDTEKAFNGTTISKRS